MWTANVDTWPEREKCTVFLLDEMHICEDLVFIKHMRTMIGYINPGDINTHSVKFERSLSKDMPTNTQEAPKSMLVFIV